MTYVHYTKVTFNPNDSTNSGIVIVNHDAKTTTNIRKLD